MSEKDVESKEVLNGVCHFHSETGTEGGYWAFQDARHIHKNVPLGFCKKCGKHLKYKGEPPPGSTWCADDAHDEYVGDRWDYEGLYILKDGDFLVIYQGVEVDKILENILVQLRLLDVASENPQAAGIWWWGYIKLREYDPFTEHTFGLWIHNDQEGVDRETWARWFMEEYPATLIIGDRD